MPKGIKGFIKGHKHSEETKRKIGLANRGIWIKYKCDYCKKECEEKESHFKKSKRHFCNQYCHSKFRAEFLPKEEHGNWKGGISKAEVHKRWITKHRERYSFLRHKEYLRHKGVDGSHTFEEWQTLKKKFDNKCAKCRENKPLTKDHVIPLSMGGTDFIWNIQPLCRNCNSKKWKKLDSNIYENPELMERKK